MSAPAARVLPSGLAGPRVHFGAGALELLGAELDELGVRRAFLAAGAHDAELAARVEAALGDRLAARAGAVVQHVPSELGAAAVADARAAGADGIVAFGGGSAVGLAKIVARETGLPIVALPTTYAGSEMTGVWGETAGGRKTTGRDARVLPRVVLYDPDCVRSLPGALAGVSALNALAHAVESLWLPDVGEPVAAVALEAVGALGAAIGPISGGDPAGGASDGGDPTARAPARADLELAQRGACLASAALANSATGVHHKLCHALGGRGLPHAPTHAVILPAAADWHAGYADDALADIAAALGAASAADGLRSLAGQARAPRTLTELGFDAHDERAVAEVVDAVLGAAPPARRPLTRESVGELLGAAVRGGSRAAGARTA